MAESRHQMTVSLTKAARQPGRRWPQLSIPSPSGDALQSSRCGVPYTRGFSGKRVLVRHFALHGAEFNAADEDDYESMTDAYIGGLKSADLLECTRSSGQLVRFNQKSQEFAVMAADKVILTYVKARPCATIPSYEPKVNCHNEKDNLTYFKKECNQ